MSTRLLRKRPSRIGPAVVVALVLLLLAVGLGWAAIAAFVSTGSVTAALTGPSGSAVAEAAGNLHWNSAPVIAVGAVLALLGLIALILGISPGARRILGVRADGSDHIGDFEVALPTSALSQIAAAAADGVDGVSGVKAASSVKSTIVTFSTPIRDHEPVRAEVEASVRNRFTSISFDRTPTVKVQARRSQS
ncbi:hypothetical protein SAMN04489752_0802 [Brevibacterium siliguriense]|uniref:DUF6286 domain-containing protein n=1 Tax=Brevibacterium siliguriense TaxID=1136497 RepID=A0A1H1NRT5_9MICO|nr:DUF6286 domain-containing protein [Brevibacterium siliguriense]SDS01704.1 hypothetical protein SAMN04489752_0802 [Brevibacterium siliguriense]